MRRKEPKAYANCNFCDFTRSINMPVRIDDFILWSDDIEIVHKATYIGCMGVLVLGDSKQEKVPQKGVSDSERE